MGKITLAAVAIAAVAIGVSGARRQAEPLIVVAQRVDLKWSSTGRLLGWLGSGARVEKLAGQGGWSRLQVRGWLPAASLAAAGQRHRVTPFEESLRETAGGRVIGALRGTVEVTVARREGDWAWVEMIGWVPDASVAPATAAEPAARPAAEAAPPDTTPPARPEPAPARATAGVAAGAVGRLGRNVELRVAPEGQALAAVPVGTVVTSLETRGGWTRVAIQGWVPTNAVEAGREDDVRPEVVAAAAPEAFVGRRMRWTVEHVALQRADRLRRDFRAGEMFALARVPGASGVYVYLAVPRRLEPAFRGLGAFETVRVEGTVRTGRSELTGNPILDVERVLP
jgi:hypothetical protein